MFAIFQKEPIITGLMGSFFVLSILGRLLLGMLYRHMIRETDNMATTENKLLKQCKLKFTNCYQMNKGMPNIPIFVDKFLSRLALGPFSFETIYHLSGQMMLLSIVCSGIGACRSILAGRPMREILPFYAASLLGLYLFFSISTLVDAREYKRILKINLVDYLENHLSVRIAVTDQDMEKVYGGKRLQVMSVTKEKMPKTDEAAVRSVRAHDGEETKEGFTEDQEKELANLLSEFLTS